MPHTITLRPCCSADDEFLFSVFCSARQDQFDAVNLVPEQVEQLLKMQFDAQRQQYRAQFPNADFDVILIDDEPAGNLYALRGPEIFVLIDITLLPEHRNQGVGGQLVRSLIDESHSAGKQLEAHVYRDNPAWRLWQRLGFDQVGDDDVYLKIRVAAVKGNFANH